MLDGENQQLMDYSDSVVAFLEYAQHIRGYATLTVYSYQRILTRFGEAMGVRSVSDVTLEAVDGYLSREIKRGLSPDGIFNTALCIRAYVRYMNRKGALGWSHELIDVPKRQRKPRQPLMMAEVQAIVDNLHRERDRLMFLIMFSSGIRVSELTNLQVKDISGMKLRVVGKGSKQRTARMHEYVAQRLMIYLSMENITAGYVFRTSTGRPVGPHVVRYAIRKAAKRAGIERKVYPHLLRHTFGAQYIENGGDVRSLQLLMGHEQIQTTMVYMNMDDPWIKEQYEKHKPHITLASPAPLKMWKSEGSSSAKAID